MNPSNENEMNPVEFEGWKFHSTETAREIDFSAEPTRAAAAAVAAVAATTIKTATTTTKR